MNEYLNLIFVLVILGVMLVGLFAILTNIIPGLIIIWGAALVYGIVEGFDLPGWIIFGILTLIMGVGSIIDNVIMGASARQSGAGWLAVSGSLLAGIVGSLIWPPFGGLIAAFVVLFAIEWLRLRAWKNAWESTRSMMAGCGWSVILRFIMGVVMLLLWGVWVLLF